MSHTIDKRREREIQKLNAKREKLSTAIKTTTDLKKKEALKTRRYKLTAQIGNLYLDQREFEKARTLYESLPWKSQGEERYYGITRELLEKKKYEEARSLLEEALTKYPESWSLLNSMGLMFQGTDNHYEALKYFERALAIVDNNNTAVLYNKALALNCLGYHEAYMIAREGVEKIPNVVGLYENLAEAARDLGSLEEANDAIQKGLALDPEYEPLKILQQDLSPRLGLKVKRHLPTKHLSSSELKKATKEYVEMLGEPTEEDLKELEEFDKKNKNKKGKRR